MTRRALFYTYALVDPRDPEEPRWIGATQCLQRRLRGHIKAANYASPSNPTAFGSGKSAWIRSLLTDGAEPKIIAIKSFHDRESAYKHETLLITESKACGYLIFNVESADSIEKNRSSKRSKMKAVKCLETGVVFESLNEAARKMGLRVYGVSSSARRGHACRGYHFQFTAWNRRAAKGK